MRLRPFLVLPTLLFALVLPGCGGSGHDGTATGAAPVAGAQQIKVEAKAYSFQPSQITLKAGQDATIVLHAADLEHDITVDQPPFHVDAGPGKTIKGGIKIVQPGRYSFYCSVAGHRAAGMQGTLVVE
ncbi:MAG: hypothetical protein QOG64_1573 [Acidimicrobiaceae bacterium]|jgi:plastocyanin|nr:hypothetical protein [Acidimicrobiaceae bacterium]